MLTLCVIVLLPYARACWRYSGCEEGELVDWEKDWKGDIWLESDQLYINMCIYVCILGKALKTDMYE